MMTDGSITGMSYPKFLRANHPEPVFTTGGSGVNFTADENEEKRDISADDEVLDSDARVLLRMDDPALEDE